MPSRSLRVSMDKESDLSVRKNGVRAIAGNNEVYPVQIAVRETVQFGVWRRSGESKPTER